MKKLQNEMSFIIGFDLGVLMCLFIYFVACGLL